MITLDHTTVVNLDENGKPKAYEKSSIEFLRNRIEGKNQMHFKLNCSIIFFCCCFKNFKIKITNRCYNMIKDIRHNEFIIFKLFIV